MQIAYCTWSMTAVPFEEGLPAIAKLGYTGIELAVTRGYPTELYTLDAARRAQIAALLKQYHIVLAAIAGHTTLRGESGKARSQHATSARHHRPGR